uniref:Uncharacterized protein n=1 Tax=Trichogramma kaykai TaxID=54128 RepID=A0ABD2VVB8_9HYME
MYASVNTFADANGSALMMTRGCVTYPPPLYRINVTYIPSYIQESESSNFLSISNTFRVYLRYVYRQFDWYIDSSSSKNISFVMRAGQSEKLHKCAISMYGKYVYGSCIERPLPDSAAGVLGAFLLSRSTFALLSRSRSRFKESLLCVRVTTLWI